MITKMRKSAESVWVKLIFVVIGLSFIGVGGNAVINGSRDHNVVEFSAYAPITYEEFLIARTRQIDSIQKQNGVSLTDENIAKIGLNRSILQQLINKAMIGYLAQYYQLDISEDKVIADIKQNSTFKNSDNQFDLNIFKSMFGGSKQREAEYVKSLKQDIIHSSIVNFWHNFYVSKSLTECILKYMSEMRVVDIIEINLHNKSDDVAVNDIAIQDLQSFYDQNQNLFVVPALRSFSYIKTSDRFFQQQIKYSEVELENYFYENQQEFAAKKFSLVKQQVQESYVAKKVEELARKLTKNLEEDVAYGLTLTEIATKHGLAIQKVQAKSAAEVNAEDSYKAIAEFIFDMSEHELSYPIETSDEMGVWLVQIDAIIPTRQQTFAEVKDNIAGLVQKQQMIANNVKKFTEYRNKYDHTSNSKMYGVHRSDNQSYIRANLGQNKFPAELITAIFTTHQGATTNVIMTKNPTYKDKAYFAYVRKITIDNNTLNKLTVEANNSFNNLIREGILQELVTYLTKKNNMQINSSFIN